MKKNDIFQIKIEDMGINGEGIGRYKEMIFFIKDAVVGDEILAGVTKLKKGYGYARLVQIQKPSPFRVKPKCPVSRQCGGCQIQNVSYDKQLQLKEKKVRDNLVRIGGIEETELLRVMEPVVGMEEPFRYRNKAQFPVAENKEGNPVFGFYAARTHQVIPIEDCYLGVEENSQILSVIGNYMKSCGVRAYDETAHKGVIRHVLIRKGFHSGQLMVCLVINGKEIPSQEKLIDELSQIPGMTGIYLNINQEKTNVILGQKTKTIWGERGIRDQIYRRKEIESGKFIRIDESVEFCISPKSFYQVNPLQTEKLYSIALDYAGLSGQEIVWDLYCGIGTISLFLAKKAKWVYGVEIVPEAIEDAKRNAIRNQIDNVEFYVGKAEEVLPKWMEQSDGEKKSPDVIVVDPPRKGLDVLCIETILQAAPRRIVYVSCDSSTLARDVKVLIAGGYTLKRVRPVDQFCHSMHVESVCLLTKVQK